MSTQLRPKPVLNTSHLRPTSGTRGLFFLHIPKTAGSFMVSLFASRFEGRSATFVERELIAGQSRRQQVRHADFASGHSRMSILRRTGLVADYDVFTVLRDPVDRLVSHLNWMDRFNHGIDRRSYMALDPEKKRLVQQLARVDPDDAQQMRDFFCVDGLAKAQLFYNLQATMMFCGTAKDILRLVELETWNKSHLKKRLSGFDAVLTLDQFKTAMHSAGVDMPAKEPVNSAKSRRFKRTPLLEDTSERFLRVDWRLFDLVSQSEPDSEVVIRRLTSPDQVLQPVGS